MKTRGLLERELKDLLQTPLAAPSIRFVPIRLEHSHVAKTLAQVLGDTFGINTQSRPQGKSVACYGLSLTSR